MTNDDEGSVFLKAIGAAAAEASEASESDVLVFATGIDDDALFQLETELRDRKRKRKNLLLMISTFGGDPHCAYRIMRRLWSAYPNGDVTMFVNMVCASAGTLMAIGANEIVMSDSAELGPLDVQLSKPDDLVARISGLTPTKALASLREEAFTCFESVFLEIQRKSRYRITLRTAADISVRLTSGLYEHLFSQIDPFRVAEIQRDNAIAMEYGRRLNRRNNLKTKALERLVGGYPAHQFVIDRQEAADTLFERVREPVGYEIALNELLAPVFRASLQDDTIFVAYVGLPEEDEKGRENEDDAQEPRKSSRARAGEGHRRRGKKVDGDKGTPTPTGSD